MGAPPSHPLLAKQKCFWPFEKQPYLLSLSLKRLEIVGDILQLLLQLGTFTVGFCKERGERKKEKKWEGKTGERRSESMCRGDRGVL